MPPSWAIPTSNETRVRVERFWKIMASERPRSAVRRASRSALSSDASRSVAATSVLLHSIRDSR